MRGLGYGEFDHVVWVTMKKDGPVLANVLLDGVLPDDLRVPESSEEGVKVTKLKIYPVRGVVYYTGSPVAGAYVVLSREVDPKTKRRVRVDAITEADGSFVPSSYEPFDGMPAGKWGATVELRRPMYTPEGKRGPNLLPAKYADVKTSGLEVEVKEGGGEVRLELEP
jgi:hypothetical protein